MSHAFWNYGLPDIKIRVANLMPRGASTLETYLEPGRVLLKITAKPGAPAIESLEAVDNLLAKNSQKTILKPLDVGKKGSFIKEGTVGWFDTARPITVGEAHSSLKPILDYLNLDLKNEIQVTDTLKQLNVDSSRTEFPLLFYKPEAETDTTYLYYHAIRLLGLVHKKANGDSWIQEFVNDRETFLQNLYENGLGFTLVLVPLKRNGTTSNQIDAVREYVRSIQSARNRQSDWTSDEALFGIPLEGTEQGHQYFLELATPNWSMRGSSGASVPCIGPGSLPRLVVDNDQRISEVTKLQQKGPPISNYENDALPPIVRVYVLDTVPSDALRNHSDFESKMRRAFPWWRTSGFEEIRVVEDEKLAALGLHALNYVATTHHRKEALNHATSDVMKVVEKMDLSNHGLFVSDILYRQIPESWRKYVQLRLVETLNRRGCGDMGAFIRVMHWLWNDIRNDKNPADFYVVNMSLSASIRDIVEKFGYDTEDSKTRNYEKPVGVQISGHNPADNADIVDIVRLFESLFRPLQTYKRGKVLLLAAAGNDGHHSQKERQPSAIPARLASVVGVSAGVVRRGKLQPADYSNIADMRMKLQLFGVEVKDMGNKGVLAFGGDIDWADWAPLWCKYIVQDTEPIPPIVLLPYSKDGVVGRYMGPVRSRDGTADQEAEQSKDDLLVQWVEWSGTSFAVPQVSGRVVAKLLEGDPQIKNVEDALYAIVNKAEQGDPEFMLQQKSSP